MMLFNKTDNGDRKLRRWQDDGSVSGLSRDQITIIVATTVVVCWLISVLYILVRRRMWKCERCTRLSRNRHRITVPAWTIKRRSENSMNNNGQIWHSTSDISLTTVTDRSDAQDTLPPSYDQVVGVVDVTTVPAGNFAPSLCPGSYNETQPDQCVTVSVVEQSQESTASVHNGVSLPSYHDAIGHILVNDVTATTHL